MPTIFQNCCKLDAFCYKSHFDICQLQILLHEQHYTCWILLHNLLILQSKWKKKDNSKAYGLNSGQNPYCPWEQGRLPHLGLPTQPTLRTANLSRGLETATPLRTAPLQPILRTAKLSRGLETATPLRTAPLQPILRTGRTVQLNIYDMWKPNNFAGRGSQGKSSGPRQTKKIPTKYLRENSQGNANPLIKPRSSLMPARALTCKIPIQTQYQH